MAVKARTTLFIFCARRIEVVVAAANEEKKES
jgi:hypothetical protein